MDKVYVNEVISYMGFVIVQTNDRTYVCPGFHEVPNGTTREQIEFTGVAPEIPQPTENQIESNEWFVPGSKPGVTYTVSVNNNNWNCTCPAKSFRRGDCKHIKSIKEIELV